MIQNYLKIGLRSLRNNALVTALNVTGLAVGFAVCLFTWLWVRHELSFDRFHPDAARTFRLSNTFKSETESFSQAPCGPAFGANVPREVAGVTSGTRYFSDSERLAFGEKRFFEQNIIFADSNFFRFFNFPVKKGDPAQFLTQPNSIILSEKVAFKYFGDQDPMGKTMLYAGDRPLMVTGIIGEPPANSQIQFDIALPMAYLKKFAAEQWEIPDVDQEWLGGWMMTYIKLADPADAPGVQSRINDLLYARAGVAMDTLKMSYAYSLQPLTDVHLNSRLRYDADNNGSLASVRVFSAIGLIVLLLACINYVNLYTAGSLRRAKETSIRKVNGAQRGQLVGQFLTESLLSALLAAGLGWGLFRLFAPGYEHLTDQQLPTDFSGQIMLFLLGLALATGLLAGLYPAFVLSRFHPAGVLKGAFQSSAKGVWLRKSLIVFQFTATVALLAAIGIVWQQMNFIRNKSLGYNKEAVVEVRYMGAPEVNRQMGALRNELLQSPAIRNVAYHGANVVGGLGNGWTTTEDLDGKEISSSLYRLSVSPEYFDTYGMELAAGRFFSGDIPSDTAKAVLVNEAAVRVFGWQKPENALGKRFGKGPDAKQVVGVVKDFHFENLHKPVDPLAIHFARRGNQFSLKADAAHLPDAIRHLEKTWQTLAPGIPLEYDFVDNQVAEQYAAEQTMQSLFLTLTGLSLLIACLGLFGLATFTAQQRTKEIGVRKVLGASVAGITGLLAKDFLKLVVLAILIATPLAYYGLNQWLSDFAYRIEIQWWVFLVAGTVAVAIAFLTVSFQSVKAALMNPVKSLRSE